MNDQTELPFAIEDSYSRTSTLILIMLLKWWNLNKVIPNHFSKERCFLTYISRRRGAVI